MERVTDFFQKKIGTSVTHLDDVLAISKIVIFREKQALLRRGGEMGIRTPEAALTAYTISSRAPSTSSDISP